MFDIKDKPGVYQIYNKTNNKRYIGSSLHVRKRWTLHLHLLRNKKHHSKHLLCAWNKYGEDQFIFSCIEYCDPECLLQTEHKYIQQYKATDSKYGYNVTEDVEHVAVLSKEDREKISKAGIGRKWTKEQREKFIKSRKGKKIKKSSETKKRQFKEGTAHLIRMGEVSKEKYDEWRRHMSEARKRYFENNPDPIRVPVAVKSDKDIMYFPCIKSAARYLNVHVDSIRNSIKRGRPSKKIPFVISYISVEFYKSIKNV